MPTDRLKPPPLPSRQPSRPELPINGLTPDQPERTAVNHDGVDGAPPRLPPKRPATNASMAALRAPPVAPGGTLTGLPAPAAPGSAPPPPALPAEFAPTKRPPLPWGRTIRAATPPAAVAMARRTPVPPPDDTPDEPEASQGQPGASARDLKEQLAAERAKVTELERRERVRTESQGPGPYQRPIERRQSPVPSSTPGKVDQAIGLTVRHLLGRAAPFLLAAAGIGGGITAVAKPSADPAKADAMLASQEAMRADVALLREQVAGMLKREAGRDQYTTCLEESLDEIGEQLLPAQDRLGSAAPLRAYTKRCKRLRP
jgi:hypothetical protein